VWEENIRRRLIRKLVWLGKWDPGRYLPERAEDKKEAYAWSVLPAPFFLSHNFPTIRTHTITAFQNSHKAMPSSY